MEEEPLIIAYLELSEEFVGGKYPLCLEVKSLKGRRKLKTLRRLSRGEFERQKKELASGYEDIHENFIHAEMMQVRYAISQLKRTKKVFVLADIINTYKKNKKTLLLESYVKNMIKEMKVDRKKNEAYFCNSLLNKIETFSSADMSLDIAMLNESWFIQFQDFLQKDGLPANVAKLDLDYLRKIYVKACQENKLKILYPF